MTRGRIRRLSGLDALSLELLGEKLADPDIFLSEIASRRHTSRQAVQQAVRRKCQKNPELARIINNRENQRRQKNKQHLWRQYAKFVVSSQQ